MNSERDYRLKLSSLKNLPPLPEGSVKIINTVSDPDVSIDELVRVLLLSPSLTSRLLGLANSAYFGYSGQITDLRKAIIQVLGLNLVKSLALSIVLNVKLDSSKCRSFDTLEYWNQSLMTALAAQYLSNKCKSRLKVYTPTVVYTSGLLLHIGLIAMVYLFPEQMDEIFQRCQKTMQSACQEIEKTVGLSHYKVGFLLMNRWKLPDVYQNVLKEFENRSYQGGEADLLTLLFICNGLCIEIIKGRPVHPDYYQNEMDILGFKQEDLQSCVSLIQENKNGIWELASIISR